MPAHLPDPEAPGERGVDVHRLPRDRLAAVRSEVLERLHVVEAVGDLDDDDSDVLRHREEHLPKRLRVRGGEGAASRLRNVLDLGRAFDQRRDIGPEVLAQLLRGHLAVLDDVVQQGGLHRLRVHPQVGHEAGDGDGVGDVRVTGPPGLSRVGLDGEGQGGAHLVDARRREIALQRLEEMISAGGGVLGDDHSGCSSWPARGSRPFRPD